MQLDSNFPQLLSERSSFWPKQKHLPIKLREYEISIFSSINNASSPHILALFFMLQ